jgi:hypothetical protein
VTGWEEYRRLGLIEHHEQGLSAFGRRVEGS